MSESRIRNIFNRDKDRNHNVQRLIAKNTDDFFDNYEGFVDLPKGFKMSSYDSSESSMLKRGLIMTSPSTVIEKAARKSTDPTPRPRSPASESTNPTDPTPRSGRGGWRLTGCIIVPFLVLLLVIYLF